MKIQLPCTLRPPFKAPQQQDYPPTPNPLNPEHRSPDLSKQRIILVDGEVEIKSKDGAVAACQIDEGDLRVFGFESLGFQGFRFEGFAWFLGGPPNVVPLNVFPNMVPIEHLHEPMRSSRVVGQNQEAQA